MAQLATFIAGGSEFILQKMEENHLFDVLKIEHISTTSPWSEAQFRAELTNAFSEIYILSTGKEIAAFIVLWRAADEIQIANLAVAPEHRRLGLASFLITTLLDRASKQGCRTAHLEVRQHNEKAVSLYNKLQFQIVGVRKKYYHSPTEDACLMSKKLSTLENKNGLV